MSAVVLACERLCWRSWPGGAVESMCTSAQPAAVSLAVLQMSTELLVLSCGVMLAAPQMYG